MEKHKLHKCRQLQFDFQFLKALRRIRNKEMIMFIIIIIKMEKNFKSIKFLKTTKEMSYIF